MTIIFAMAGKSSRFFDAGYKVPKFMLTLESKSVFEYAVASFKAYFQEWKFIFVYRNEFNTKEFIEEKIKILGIKNFELVELSFITKGQAESVNLALKNVNDDENILIFNIDTFRPNFKLPNLDFNNIDGYLEVFKGEGDHWSFIEIKGSKVIKTAEKIRISNLCSSGLYYFKKAKDFKKIFKEMQKENNLSKGEFYVAPMYNSLIQEGKFITFYEISLDEIVFCGTPSEYEELKRKMKENILDSTKSYIKAFDSKDLNTINELLDSNFVLEDPVVKRIQGKQKCLDAIEDIFKQNENLSFKAVNIFIDNDTALIEFILILDSTKLKGVDILKWNKGKLMELRAYLDTKGEKYE